MYAKISVEDAILYLQNRYQKMYNGKNNLSINFDLVENSHTYTDYGGFTETERFYELRAKIQYSQRIGLLEAYTDIVKKTRDLSNDLISELNELGPDDEWMVSHALIPTMESYKIDYHEEVIIYFKEKELNDKVKVLS